MNSATMSAKKFFKSRNSKMSEMDERRLNENINGKARLCRLVMNALDAGALVSKVY